MLLDHIVGAKEKALFIGTCKVLLTAYVGKYGQAVNSSVQNSIFHFLKLALCKPLFTVHLLTSLDILPEIHYLQI